MFSRILNRLGGPLLGAAGAVLVLGAAAQGSHLGSLLLGHVNTANETTELKGSAGPELRVTNTASGAAVRAESNGGKAVSALRTASIGVDPAVQGDTSSTAQYASGVKGEVKPSAAGSYSAGVYGLNDGTGTLVNGVWGHAQSGKGVRGTSPFGKGVSGESGNGIGVYGTTATGPAGVQGDTSSTDKGYGVLGRVTGSSTGSGTAAVAGINNATTTRSYGVYGYKAANGVGVTGVSPDGYGVNGVSKTSYGGSFATDSGRAVDASHFDSGNSAFLANATYGVYGKAASLNGKGVSGIANNGASAYGIYGQSTSGYAGYFSGDVKITGTLTKAGGAFRIDHPLDPSRRYLQHSFVESPDMMDIYNGNVRTDRSGLAVVRLPKYFQALNRTFRYQLTIVGRRFGQALVWTPIRHDRFTIRTSRPYLKVSWQVTGIRHDPYANAHRIRVVEPKPVSEKGTYLHPELYRSSPSPRQERSTVR